jgi:putative transposase
MTDEPKVPKPPTPEALERFVVVSQVITRERSGVKRSEAVDEVVSTPPACLLGEGKMEISRSTAYRWLSAYRRDGIAGLERAERKRTDSSIVLPKEFEDFAVIQKRADPRASIPEVIKRARFKGVIGAKEFVDRTTVWRAVKRKGVPAARRKKALVRDSRRFAFPHRMDMVLCDGKHFRVGAGRLRRVALFFLDDATRRVLEVIVGTSENTELFLHGLRNMVRRYGKFSILYLDHGPGFISLDTIEVARKLDALLIHGEKAYPQGHGKVERFNQTALMQLLRGLDGRPDVDPDCGALTLRLSHYVHEVYNHAPHESLGMKTPADRFNADSKPLRFHDNDRDLQSRFVLHIERRVSNDHVVSVDGVQYEVPRGHAGERVTLHRRLLDGTIAMIHDGRLVELHVVDLAGNARDRRARIEQEPSTDDHQLPLSAADLAFLRAMGPVVDADGGFRQSINNEQEKSK